VELVWGEGSQLIDLVPVWSWRLTMKPQEGFGIRVTTDADPIWGIPAEAPKFVVHAPESQSGSPISDSLMRCVAILWLFKKLALADWGIFCEVFGMPVRIGKYPPGASPEEKKQLFEMLEKMGANTWGAFSAGTEIELTEAVNRGTSPFEAFISLINREFGVAFTGGNLPTDTTGGTGTFAAANVQEGVREDLRDADIADESCMVREQMLTPMVQFAFGPDAPVPYFQRVKPEAIDRLNEANVIQAAQRAGMKVGLEWAHKRLSIPKPDADDEALRPSMDLFGAALEEGEENAETPGEEEN
jgi:phage gp29-like protein